MHKIHNITNNHQVKLLLYFFTFALNSRCDLLYEEEEPSMFSYNFLCRKILPVFQRFIHSEEEELIYTYALESLLSTIVNFCIVFLIGYFFDLLKPIAIYMLFFSSFRYFEGGIHAKNHIRCILLFLTLMFSCFFISHLLCHTSLTFYMGFFIFPCRILYTILQILVYKKNQKKRVFFLLSLTIGSIIGYLYTLFANPYYANIMLLALLIHLLTSIPCLQKET